MFYYTRLYRKRKQIFYSQNSEQPVQQLENVKGQFMAQLVPQLQTLVNNDVTNSEQPVPKLENAITEQVAQQLQMPVNKEVIISEQVVRQLALVPWGITC